MPEGDLFEVRLQKLESLEAGGVDAFPRGYAVEATIGDLRSRYDDWDADRLQAGDARFRLAGRIVSARGHGKTQFSDIDDGSARIQLYVRRDDIGEESFVLWENLDLGDFVGVEGELMRTRSGELTLRVSSYSLLSKALRPLPEKWHGLKDTEIRYRQRYLDLAANEDVRENFRKRAAAMRALRAHLDANGFIEVETPVMQPQYGGALARPFTTHHNALDVDFYLRIAPELYLKRLLVGGLPRVYELARNFRNEGISTRHNPEFTMLEFYAAYWDYEVMMTFAEELLCVTVDATLGAGDFEYQERKISMARPWKRMRFADALVNIAGVPVDAVMDVDALRGWDGLRDELTERAEQAADLRLADLWELAFERYVQPTLIAPTFITHFPREISPFSKASPDDEGLVERFELFCGGLEVSNGYSELNDPRLQRRSMEAMGDAPGPELNEQRVDEDYITALEHGMPPAAGIGIGIDRLMMLLTDSASIRDVILFPQLKPKNTE